MTDNPHDALFQYVFSNPEHAAPALRTMLPAALAQKVDFSTLTLAPGHFVDPEARRSSERPPVLRQDRKSRRVHLRPLGAPELRGHVAAFAAARVHGADLAVVSRRAPAREEAAGDRPGRPAPQQDRMARGAAVRGARRPRRGGPFRARSRASVRDRAGRHQPRGRRGAVAAGDDDARSVGPVPPSLLARPGSSSSRGSAGGRRRFSRCFVRRTGRLRSRR